MQQRKGTKREIDSYHGQLIWRLQKAVTRILRKTYGYVSYITATPDIIAMESSSARNNIGNTQKVFDI